MSTSTKPEQASQITTETQLCKTTRTLRHLDDLNTKRSSQSAWGHPRHRFTCKLSSVRGAVRLAGQPASTGGLFGLSTLTTGGHNYHQDKKNALLDGSIANCALLV